MSGLLAGKVWQSNLEAHLKPLAAAMADIANDDGTSIFPSVAYLAWLLGKGERSVQYGLEELKTKGVIIPQAYEHGGRGRATEYRLVPSSLPARAEWKETRKGATSAPFKKGKRVQTTAPFSDEKGATDAPFTDDKRVQPTTERVQFETERVQPTAPQPSLDTSVPVKPLSAHAELMAFHAGFLDGPIPDASTQGKALKELLKDYSLEECQSYYVHLRGEKWRSTPVTWLTVKRGIADWLARGRTANPQGNGHKSKGEYDPLTGELWVPKEFTWQDAAVRCPEKNADDIKAHFEGKLEWKDVRDAVRA